MFHYEWLLLMQTIMAILMIVFLQKLNTIKKQIDTITKEVMQYISYVTEDIVLEKEQEISLKKAQKWDKKQPEDAQNRLIQAVLQDFFP